MSTTIPPPKADAEEPLVFRMGSSGLLLRVAPSTIPDAGMGLYATSDIAKGDAIGYYGGVLLTKKEAHTEDGEDGINNYVFEVFQDLFIDGAFLGNALRYVNHAAGRKTNCDSHSAVGERGAPPRITSPARDTRPNGAGSTCSRAMPNTYRATAA